MQVKKKNKIIFQFFFFNVAHVDSNLFKLFFFSFFSALSFFSFSEISIFLFSFFSAHASGMLNNNEDKVREAFNAVDVDGDGVLGVCRSLHDGNLFIRLQYFFDCNISSFRFRFFFFFCFFCFLLLLLLLF